MVVKDASSFTYNRSQCNRRLNVCIYQVFLLKKRIMNMKTVFMYRAFEFKYIFLNILLITFPHKPVLQIPVECLVVGLNPEPSLYKD